MTEPRDQSDIWTESAVFDYVAGHLSDDARAEFEKRMATDQSLRDAVTSEQRLRTAMEESIIEERVFEDGSDDNIDKLMQSIDDLEQLSQDPSYSAKSTTPRAQNLIRIAGVAACIMVAIMVVVNQQPDPVNPEFVLLSDPSSNQIPNFEQLVRASRVAQVWLTPDADFINVEELLKQHQLTPISRAGSAWIVTSPEPISDARLSTLMSEPQFDRIALIAFDTLTAD